MHTLNRQRTKQKTGTQPWRNPTDRTLKIKIYGGKNQGPRTHEVKPGESIEFPAAWSRATCLKVCKFVVPEAEYDADGDDRPTREVKPAPPPPQASAALGDPSKMPDEEARKERASDDDDSHSSGDALEAYAQTLMKKPKAQLQKMAADMGLSVEDDDGKALAKGVLARAIAIKSVEDPGD